MFVDETGTSTKMVRTRGRCACGRRLVAIYLMPTLEMKKGPPVMLGRRPPWAEHDRRRRCRSGMEIGFSIWAVGRCRTCALNFPRSEWQRRPSLRKTRSVKHGEHYKPLALHVS